MQETVDGTIITTLHTDQDGRTWHIMRREGGSVCLYATRRGESCHYVHFDTLDGWTPTNAALAMFGQLAGAVEAINALLVHVPA